MIKYLVLRLYYFAIADNRIAIFRKIDRILRKIGGKSYSKTLGQLKYKLRFNRLTDNKVEIEGSKYWDCEKEICPDKLPLVSILIPDAQVKKQEQLKCNLGDGQTYTNIEVIAIPLLASDNFLTWIERGVKAAEGQLIWIKEADSDFDEKFLENMVSLFNYESVMMGMKKGSFVNKDERKGIFEKEPDPFFFMSATNFVKELLDSQSFEVNLEEMVFRNPRLITWEKDKYSDLYKYDKLLWILNLIRGGIIGCIGNSDCWYSELKEENLHVEEAYELEKVSCFIASKYKLNIDVFQKTEERLGKQAYSLQKIVKEMENREPNIIMACYAFKLGGGETYPIYLVNEIRRRGLTVTILNFDLVEREQEIVALIDQGIPIINIKHTDYIGKVLHDIGVDIVHSHEATVDYFIALWINRYPDLARHIVTLHGMYEEIDEIDCTRTIQATLKSVYRYIYIADKNLDCFKKRKVYTQNKFQKMINGLPEIPVHPVEREKLGIKEEDFVIVLASRAIPNKGWKEAIEAVVQANQCSKCSIHLILLGDGEIKKKLEKNAPEYIHFLGTVTNVRDYFAMGDVGILPSTYKGESYPIVIIECLMAGKPIIATDIAEVSRQISDEEGHKAGLLIPMVHWKVKVQDICNAILVMVNDQEVYSQLKDNVRVVKEKFDLKKIVDQYVQLYEEAGKTSVY